MHHQDVPDFAVVDIEAASPDTVGSALTGRHPPAAREHSHLFGLSRVRVHLLSAWFSGAQAIHERRSQ